MVPGPLKPALRGLCRSYALVRRLLLSGPVMLLVADNSSQPIEHGGNTHAVECSRIRRDYLLVAEPSVLSVM